MNIISQSMVQDIAVQASDHSLLLWNFFESFFLWQESSDIATQHPIVRTYGEGTFNIDA